MAAGRAEPVADDDAEKKSAEADRRSLDEIHRYENARPRATHAVEKAEGAKDEAKTGEARAAVEALDSEFVAAIKKIDEARPPKTPARTEKKGDGSRGKGEGTKKEMGD